MALTPQQKDTVYDELFNGKSLREICEQLNITRRHLYNEQKSDPSFHQRVKEIREEIAHDMVDDLKGIADNCHTMVDVNVARLKADNIKWEAAKRCPTVYGDRLDLNINQTLDLTAVLSAANARVSPLLQALARDVSPPVAAQDEEAEQLSQLT